MSAYRDALTKLFLKGSFAKGDVLPLLRSDKIFEETRQPPSRLRKTAQKSSPAGPSRHPPSVEGKLPQTPVVKPESVQDHAHPGKLLAGKLRACGKTASDLARDMRVPVNRVTAIINGQRGITADTALRLGHWFGESPESWLDAQQQYELARARAGSGEEIRRLPRLVRT